MTRYTYLWPRCCLLLLAVVVLLLTGCGEVAERAQQPLPPADPPTAAQQAVQQQLVDSHDRELALQAQLGAQASTLKQQAERVAKAEGLVEDAKRAMTAAMASARADERASVEAAGKQQLVAAVAVERLETDKYKADAKDAREHAFRMTELALGVLALLAALIAVEIPVERTKAATFAGACAALAVVLMVVDAALVYIEWALALMGTGGALYLAVKHINLHGAMATIAAKFPTAGLSALEGRALLAWHALCTEIHGLYETSKLWVDKEVSGSNAATAVVAAVKTDATKVEATAKTTVENWK